MLNIKFIRENPNVIKKDLKRRNAHDKLSWVDDIIRKDEEYLKHLQNSQKLRHRRNELSGEINKLKKEGKDIKNVVKEAKEIPDKIKKVEEKISNLVKDIRYKQMNLPNILHKSVPIGKDESGNEILWKVGKTKKIPGLISHGEWLERNDQADFKRATKISGAGFFFLKDKVALLDLALQRFAIDMILKKGYTLIQPPFLMRREPYEGVTDLRDFEKVMYKIEDDEMYLIATSEHPIGGMFIGEMLTDLPVKLVGVSTCFRREIGSHGIDTRGLFRVHQFNKVEQFVFCKPSESWKLHEELLKNAEEIYKKLELPYRVVNICTGDIGTVAAKKYDLEVWMPREKKYREVVSCSNCTAYQATRLGIKFMDGAEKEYVHTLNSTALATSRTIRAIIENFQQKDGSVLIPKVLVPYMNGIKRI